MAVEVNNTATQANADKRTYSVQEIAGHSANQP